MFGRSGHSVYSIYLLKSFYNHAITTCYVEGVSREHLTYFYFCQVPIQNPTYIFQLLLNLINIHVRSFPVFSSQNPLVCRTG